MHAHASLPPQELELQRAEGHQQECYLLAVRELAEAAPSTDGGGGGVVGLPLAVEVDNIEVAAEQHASADEHGAEPGSGAVGTEQQVGNATLELRCIPLFALQDAEHSALLGALDEGEPQASVLARSAEEGRTGDM